MSLNISQDSIKLACLALNTALPDLTPELLTRILEDNYSVEKEKVELVSVHEAAKILCVCTTTVYRMLDNGKLTKYPVGNGRLYRLNRFELIKKE